MNRNELFVALSYGLTVFVSALLLFVIQPMAGEMVLPHLGGSSAVWTTSMLFFQLILLAGYIYAHGIAQNFSFSTQVILHILVVVIAIFFLPASIPEDVLRIEQYPAFYLTAALIIGIGPPTFVVSSSAPLLQHWFGGLQHPHAEDPYYLYAASNAGSLIALLSYPFLIERFLTLDTQARGWTIGFFILTILIGTCGILVFSRGRNSENQDQNGVETSISWSRRAWWVLITFIPSSLMLGVTHYLTMDIASVPLLWVIPLALYLLSYILVFARIKHPLNGYRILLPSAVLVVFALTFGDVLSIVLTIVLHTAIFFFVALFFHGKLAEDRPSVEHLTGYYICMALGGSLGGIFNALIAPVLFNQLIEYVLVLTLGLICVFQMSGNSKRNWLTHWGTYHISGIACIYFLYTVPLHLPDPSPISGSPEAFIGGITFLLLLAGLILKYFFHQGFLLNAVLSLILLFGFLWQEDRTNTITKERSFYGQYEVFENSEHTRTFMHGTTNHGIQHKRNGKLLNKATGYYHPRGPFGDLFNHYNPQKVGIAGLGAGGLAPYQKQGSEFHFFEIDPVVHDIARSYFGYLEACGTHCQVHIGDARQLIQKRPPDSFDMLIMDAYTSDAIPTHLLTREAVQLYLSRLKNDGLIALHISNRHFNLERVVGAIARELGAAARVKTFSPLEEMDPFNYFNLYNFGNPMSKRPAPWTELQRASGIKLAVIARDESILAPLDQTYGWRPPSESTILWTDNYTNIIPLLFTNVSD